MPTYDFECQKCGQKFELFQQMTDPPQGKCPKCGSKKVKRLIGAGSGIIFKGTGFYETDYKRKEQKPKPEEKKESKPADKKQGNTK